MGKRMRVDFTHQPVSGAITRLKWGVEINFIFELVYVKGVEAHYSPVAFSNVFAMHRTSSHRSPKKKKHLTRRLITSLQLSFVCNLHSAGEGSENAVLKIQWGQSLFLHSETSCSHCRGGDKICLPSTLFLSKYFPPHKKFGKCFFMWKKALLNWRKGSKRGNIDACH